MNKYFNQLASASTEQQIAILIDLLLDSLYTDNSEIKAYISSINVNIAAFSSTLGIKLEILGK